MSRTDKDTTASALMRRYDTNKKTVKNVQDFHGHTSVKLKNKKIEKILKLLLLRKLELFAVGDMYDVPASDVSFAVETVFSGTRNGSKNKHRHDVLVETFEGESFEYRQLCESLIPELIQSSKKDFLSPEWETHTTLLRPLSEDVTGMVDDEGNRHVLYLQHLRHHKQNFVLAVVMHERESFTPFAGVFVEVHDSSGFSEQQVESVNNLLKDELFAVKEKKDKDFSNCPGKDIDNFNVEIVKEYQSLVQKYGVDVFDDEDEEILDM